MVTVQLVSSSYVFGLAFAPQGVYNQQNGAKAHDQGKDLRKEIGSVIINRCLVIRTGIPIDPAAGNDQRDPYADISFFHGCKLLLVESRAAIKPLSTNFS